MVAKIFSYGSNMLTSRIGARVGSVNLITTGYVARRRLEFHKRSIDGSAKANAVHTGNETDFVWGVVFSLTQRDKSVLDEIEQGYNAEEVIVMGQNGEVAASMYVARTEWIDASLKPYCWYHRYVVQGAIEHQLPSAYIQHLHSHDFVVDGDQRRLRRHTIKA